MRILQALLAAVLVGVATPAVAQNYQREAAAARELQQMCDADRGQLWGQSLCGPLLIADPATRTAWASQADGQGRLYRYGEGWVGELPEGVPIASTALDWGGVSWIMVMGPLPEDPVERRVLLGHEAWHHIQASLGLAAQSGACAHLETEQGRFLLRMEMRALAVALRSSRRAREEALSHALAFRAARLAMFRAAAYEEAALDRNEGLAAYTGVVLGAGDESDFFATRTLDQFDSHDRLARAYAYATGPAYGLLLDGLRPNWRGFLGAYAPADLAAAQVRPAPQPVAQIAERYGGASVASEERARAVAERTRVAALRALFTGPRLELPLTHMQIEFDPNQVTPVQGLGAVYERLTLRDAWGELIAGEGALISENYALAMAPAPGADGLSGPGWRLALAPGYRISGPDPAGVFRPEPAPPQ